LQKLKSNKKEWPTAEAETHGQNSKDGFNSDSDLIIIKFFQFPVSSWMKNNVKNKSLFCHFQF
jgi:hypothetical protein